MAASEERQKFLATLPRKRVAAGALIRDQNGHICLVEPTYRTKWSFPGGTVETDESPSQGCFREVREEIGLDLDPGRLLCVDWVASGPDPDDALVFVYDGGVLDAEEIDRIVTPPDELHGFRFVALDDVPALITERNLRRVRAAFGALADGGTREIGG